jgi:hypothetical protein
MASTLMFLDNIRNNLLFAYVFVAVLLPSGNE